MTEDSNLKPYGYRAVALSSAEASFALPCLFRAPWPCRQFGGWGEGKRKRAENAGKGEAREGRLLFYRFVYTFYKQTAATHPGLLCIVREKFRGFDSNLL